MRVKQSRVSGHIPDLAFLVLTLLLNLMPWLPFIRNGLTGNQIRYPSFGQDQMHYVARAHAIWQGKKSSAGFTSAKTGIEDGLGNFAEYILFLPSKLFLVEKLPFQSYFYSLLFISSFVSLTACYYFFKFLMKSRINAASLTLIFVFFSGFLDFGGLHFPAMPIFNRWPTPMLHYLLIFVFLRVIIDSEFRRRKIIGALILASSFYLYLYAWQTLSAMVVSAILIMFIFRNLIEVKSLLSISMGGIIFAIPAIAEILQLLISSKSDNLLQFAFRQQDSRMPSSDKMSYILCVFALTAWAMRKLFSRNIRYFTSLCALTGIIVSNQQVITGKVLQPGHFHWYFIAPAFFSCAAIIFLTFVGSRKVGIMLFMALLVIFTTNQTLVIPAAQREASTQYLSGLSLNQTKSLKGVVFTQDPIVLDQLATSYSGGLYWHPFGVYYNGSRELASESVLFSAIWLGSNSPIKLNPLLIECADFQVEPCSTARMLLGSESKMDWFEYVADGNPVQRSIVMPNSSFAKLSRAVAMNPDLYFDQVISNRKIETIISSKPASQHQLELLGTEWKQLSTDKKFWIYIRVRS